MDWVKLQIGEEMLCRWIRLSALTAVEESAEGLTLHYVDGRQELFPQTEGVAYQRLLYALDEVSKWPEASRQ